ncbi:MAG: transposase [Chloroflexota bacterium]|nr:transposase [Chloroflexota bacterium]
MPIPIVCLDARVRQWAACFSRCFSKPQYQHFVTVLLGLLLCQEARTLTGLRRQVAGGPSIASLSRFIARAPWDEKAVVRTWLARFQTQVAPLVQAERARQRHTRPRQVGRPKEPLVTGYLIGDDSTLAKPKGKKMEGVGHHYSSTADARVRGHSLVQGLYVLLGRRCPLAPQLYQQKSVCAARGVPFQSKIDLMEEHIRTFAPVAGTRTHVLLDSWYGAKRLWKAARDRGFLITTGLKANRSLRVPDPDAERGWRWQRLSEYAAGLTAGDFTLMDWPRQGDNPDEPRQVYVHVVQTRLRSLYRCQLVIARPALDAPASATRYWASSDLAADAPTLLGHIAARWAVEVFFSDTKDLLGLDQYQLMTTTAIVRFWTLVLAAYTLIEEERARLAQEQQRHITIGEARRALQRLHYRHLLGWIEQELHAGSAADALYDRLAA